MLKKKWQHYSEEKLGTNWLNDDEEPSCNPFEDFEPVNSEWGSWHVISVTSISNQAFRERFCKTWRRLLIQKEETNNV